MGIIDKMIFDNYTKALATQDFKQAELALRMAKIYKFLVEKEGFIDYSEGLSSHLSSNYFLSPKKFRYYPESRVLILDSKKVYLTEKENKLFKFISEKASNLDSVRIITKQEIADSVWKGKQFSDKAIRQLIHRIRRKIEHDPKNPQMLINIYNKGFTFWAIKVNVL